MSNPTIYRLLVQEQHADMSRRRHRDGFAASGRRTASSRIPRVFRFTPRSWRRRFAV